MGNSKPKGARRKAAPGLPDKPYPDFPLTPHRSGAWQKKIRGTVRYFGRWGKVTDGKLLRLPDPDYWKPALEIYKAQADDWYAGRTPRVKKVGQGLTLGDLCNRFLTAKLQAQRAGEITATTFAEYRQTTDLLVAQFGRERLVDDLASDDFEKLRTAMAERWGPVRLGNGVQRVRSVLKYGYESGLIVQAVRYGPQFKKPSAAVLRKHRAQDGHRMLEAEEIRRLLAAAPVPLRAMVLLGLNCGFTQKDCADLPLKVLDLEQGWLDFPRPKTGVERRCALWSETVAALREAIAQRPEPRSEEVEGLVFLTSRGRPWVSGMAARQLMKAAGVHREGIGLATLRHVFRMVADGCRDQVAVNYVMGHADPSMGAVYRERIEDGRLRAVAECVRAWLFGSTVQ